MHRSLLFIAGLILAACSGQSPAPRFEIAIAPLALPGVGDVCYDLIARDGPNGTGATIWAAGDPTIDGDPDALCASSFGNGAGGAITFIGTCDATPITPGNPRTNSVTLWVDTLENTAGQVIAQAGPDGWQDPCPNGCVLNADCLENQDTRIEFNITILRQANQGFFDIGVNFDDIFCSTKVDCRDDQNRPLDLLFRNGQRDTTIVAAFACTAGPGSDIQTELFRTPLTVSCATSTTTIPASTSKGNGFTASSPDPAPADAVWQYAVYADEEQLSCGASSCNKLYWNFAIGLDESFDNCTLTTRMSAGRLGQFAGLSTPSQTTYPYIDVEVPLTDTTGLVCSKHPLNGLNSGVTTRYTPITSPQTFTASYSGLVDECSANTDNCAATATCNDLSIGFQCQCNAGYVGTGVTCNDVNECLTANGGCSANASCTNSPGSRTCTCISGYSGDGLTCNDINECLVNNGGCNANATCTNSPGSRTCACNAGYIGDGITCTANTNGLLLSLDPSTYSGSGTSWPDASGNGTHATLVNGPTYQSTQAGSFLFNGTSQYAYLPYLAAINAAPAFTISMWVRSNSISSEQMLFSTTASGFSAGWHIELYQSKMIFQAYPSGTWVASTQTLSSNTWYHLAVTSVGGTQTFYVNGVARGTANLAYTASTTAPRIGFWSGNSTYQFSGNIALVRFHNQALSSTDLSAYFEATRSRFGL